MNIQNKIASLKAYIDEIFPSSIIFEIQQNTLIAKLAISGTQPLFYHTNRSLNIEIIKENNKYFYVADNTKFFSDKDVLFYLASKNKLNLHFNGLINSCDALVRPFDKNPFVKHGVNSSVIYFNPLDQLGLINSFGIKDVTKAIRLHSFFGLDDKVIEEVKLKKAELFAFKKPFCSFQSELAI